MRKSVATLLSSGALGMALLLAACGGPSGGQQGQGGPPTPQVPVAQVIVRELAPSSEFNGSLTAPKSVELRPRVSGQIIGVDVPEGGMVRQGQTLFRIDPRPFQVAVDQAAGNFAQAEAQAAQAQADFARAERLIATGAISRKEYDAAVAQRRAGLASVQAARAAVAAARLDLSFTRVTAPISGRVDRILVTEGNVVAGGAQATPLTTIKSVNPLYAEFDIDEATYLSFVEKARRAGTATKLPVEFGLMTDEGFPRTATLDFLGNGIDRSAGTIRARALVQNADGALAPGLFARIRLVTGERQQSILIDDQAVGNDQGKSFVLILAKGNKVDFRPVELGPIVDGLRVIKSGLQPSDTVIIKGLVRPGMQVVPRKGPMQQSQGNGNPQAAAKPAAEAR